MDRSAPIVVGTFAPPEMSRMLGFSGAARYASFVVDGPPPQLVLVGFDGDVLARADLTTPLRSVRSDSTGRTLLLLTDRDRLEIAMYLPGATAIRRYRDVPVASVVDAVFCSDGSVLVVVLERGAMIVKRYHPDSELVEDVPTDPVLQKVAQVWCSTDGYAAVLYDTGSSKAGVRALDPSRAEGSAIAADRDVGYALGGLAVGNRGQYLAAMRSSGIQIEVRPPFGRPVTARHDPGAVGPRCMATFRSASVAAYRFTDDGTEEWGSRWVVNEPTQVWIDEADDTFLAVRHGDDLSILRLPDYDILELGHHDGTRRHAAATRLGDRRRLDAVPDLARLLISRDPADRLVAAEVLGVLGTDRALDALLAIVSDDGDDAAIARQLMSELPLERVAVVVTRALASTRPSAIRGALQVLAARPELEMTTELCALMSSGTDPTRRSAARLLSDRADRRSFPTLLAALADPDEGTATAAWPGVARIAGLSPSGDEGPPSFDTTAAFVARVLQTGRIEPAAIEHPVGAGLLGRIADALSGAAPATDALNALQGLGDRNRFGGVATVTGLLLADRLADAGPLLQAVLRFVAEGAAAVRAPEVEWRTRGRLGDLAARAGNWRQANDSYTLAEGLLERMWADLLGETSDRMFFQDKAGLYESAMLCRLRLGRAADALDTLERAKTRFLGDLIARRHLPPDSDIRPIDDEFWRAAGRRRPVRPGLPDPRSAGWNDQEVVSVTLEPDPLSTPVLPRGLIRAVEVRGDSETAVYVLRDLWSVVASLLAGGYTGAEEDVVRTAFATVDETIRDRLDLGSGAADLDTHVDRCWAAAEALRELQTDERVHGWALREYFDKFRDGLREVPEWIPLTDAVGEVASFVTGRTPVWIAPCEDETVGQWMAGHDAVPTFQAGPPGPARPGTTEAASATSAVDVLVDRRWDYVTRLARGVTAGVPEAGSMLADRPRTALLAFAVTDQGTVTYAVGSDVDLARQDLPALAGWATPVVFHAPEVTTNELSRRLTGPDGPSLHYAHRRLDAGTAWRASLNDALRWLHQHLFEPLRSWLRSREVERLVVVPHRGLHAVPLGAWWEPHGRRRRYVLDDFEITYAPSITLLDIARRRASTGPSSPTRPLALLDPTDDLPLARLDSLAVAEAMPPDRVVAGREVTRSALRTHALDADPLHYAGHAQYEWDDPLGSWFKLADGLLTLGDLFDEQVVVSPGLCAVLAGCETDMTDARDAADEHLSLASGFLFAGATSIVSTLWSIGDIPAMLLTHEYYARRRRGQSPPAALQAAQIWLREAKRSDVLTALDRVEASERHEFDAPFRRRLRELRDEYRSADKHSAFADPSVWAAYTVSGLGD